MSLPWEYHPDLTYDRLVEIGLHISAARDAAVDRHDTTIGDDDWVLGCRAFQACRHRLQLAESELPWLAIIDPSRHFIFRIGAVPVRFYRGDPEDPSHRTKAQSFPELAQLSLAFPGSDVREVVYRIAVQTDLDGRALTVHFVGLMGDNVVLNWTIPIDTVAPSVALLRGAAEGVELAPPVVDERDDGFESDESEEAPKADQSEIAGR